MKNTIKIIFFLVSVNFNLAYGLTPMSEIKALEGASVIYSIPKDGTECGKMASEHKDVTGNTVASNVARICRIFFKEGYGGAGRIGLALQLSHSVSFGKLPELKGAWTKEDRWEMGVMDLIFGYANVSTDNEVSAALVEAARGVSFVKYFLATKRVKNPVSRKKAREVIEKNLPAIYLELQGQ